MYTIVLVPKFLSNWKFSGSERPCINTQEAENHEPYLSSYKKTHNVHEYILSDNISNDAYSSQKHHYTNNGHVACDMLLPRKIYFLIPIGG